MTGLHELLQRRRPGWSLEQAFYCDDAIYRAELTRIFATHWLFVGHTCEVAEPGDWFRVDIDVDSLIVVRSADGTVRAFHNTCRHRGSLICVTQRGHSRRLTCPYHQWTYLVSSSEPDMDDDSIPASVSRRGSRRHRRVSVRTSPPTRPRSTRSLP